MSLIDRLLQKRGLTIDELEPEERTQIDEWKRKLDKEELTIEDLKEFIKQQLGIIKGKWSDYNLEQSKKNELLPYFTVYETLLAAIDSPRSEREAIESHLNQLIHG